MVKRCPVVIGGLPRRSSTEIVDLSGLNKDYLMGFANSCGWKQLNHDEVREEAASLGTNLHAWVKRHFTGEVQPESDPFDDETSDRVRELFSAWETWAFGRNINYERIEQQIISPRLLFHGTPDLVAEETIGTLTSRWLYDWKTSSKTGPSIEHWLQVASYVDLLEDDGVYIDGVCIVVICKADNIAREARMSLADLAPYRRLFRHLLAFSLELDEIAASPKKRARAKQ